MVGGVNGSSPSEGAQLVDQADRMFASVARAEGFLSTGDVEQARAVVAGIDFFETAFGAGEEDQAELHAQVMSTLRDEVHGWHDETGPAP
jgi:hypothetical protein